MPPSHERAIYDAIRKKIKSGEWAPGAKLPTIRELADEHECSWAPVRAALRDLQKEKIIEGQRGVGNFVAKGQQKATE